MTFDEEWMRRAIQIAQKGAGAVHPNPMVGAMVVKGKRLISTGYHAQYGGPHAEVEALRRAGARARGATLYVTLEPCSHWGKTPPCVDAVVASGIQRVVAAMKDPNPLVAGKGFARLRSHHIRVQSGVCEVQARELNRAYVTRITTGRPYVTMKVASSLDGRTATVTGESQWITSPASRRQGHQWRARVDAIAVGAGTILQDNPTLTSHGQGRDPIRIIFAGRRVLPKSSKVFNSASPTWVIRGAQGAAALRKRLRLLAQQGITHILLEGGRTLQNAFLEAGLVDEVLWFVAPVILGVRKRLAEAIRIRGASDICIRGKVER